MFEVSSFMFKGQRTDDGGLRLDCARRSRADIVCPLSSVVCPGTDRRGIALHATTKSNNAAKMAALPVIAKRRHISGAKRHDCERRWMDSRFGTAAFHHREAL